MDNWYYEYDVTVVEDDEEVVRRGIVCNESFAAVAKDLDDFYGEELVRINKIACITDGVYQFNRPEAEFKIHVEA